MGKKACVRCYAIKRERDLPTLQHDLDYHVEMLLARHDPRSVCVQTGLSAHTLQKCGYSLSVDRIDSTRGYVRGNCQLMAKPLNTAKGPRDTVPQSAINRVMRRVERRVNSRHDRTPKVQAQGL